MTKTQFIKKIKSMNRDIVKGVEKESLRLFYCGGIDPEKFENDYALPKIILHVAFKNTAFQYKPLSEYKEDSENLENF